MTADEVFLAAVAQETDSSLDRLVGSSVSMGKTRIRRSRSDGGARSVRNRKCKRKLKRCINQLLSKGSSRGRKGCKNKSVKCRRNRRGGRGRNCCPRRRPKPRPRKLASPIPVHTSPTPALTSSTSVSTSPISTHKPSQERVAFPPNLLRSSSALKMHYNRRIVAGSNLITVRKKAGLPSVTAARPRETGRGILQPSPTHLRRRHKRNVRESGFRVFGNTDRCNLAIGKNRELCEKTLNYGVLLPWKFVRKEVSTKFGYDVRTDMVQIRYPGQYIVYANVSYLEGDGSLPAHQIVRLRPGQRGSARIVRTTKAQSSSVAKRQAYYGRRINSVCIYKKIRLANRTRIGVRLRDSYAAKTLILTEPFTYFGVLKVVGNSVSNPCDLNLAR